MHNPACKRNICSCRRSRLAVSVCTWHGPPLASGVGLMHCICVLCSKLNTGSRAPSRLSPGRRTDGRPTGTSRVSSPLRACLGAACLHPFSSFSALIAAPPSAQPARRRFRRECLAPRDATPARHAGLAYDFAIVPLDRRRTLSPSKSPAWKADGWKSDGRGPSEFRPARRLDATALLQPNPLFTALVHLFAP